MIYNILLVDQDKYISKNSKFLELLQDKEILHASNKEQLIFQFITQEIHIIILNLDVIDLNGLSSTLEELSLKYQDIPVFILGKYNKDCGVNSLIIYDFIDVDEDEILALNKIKFCQKLYQKELQHEKNIKKLLYIDNLTKLPNRIKLIKDIKDKDIGIKSLAIIDINSFKDINDFFGHKIGDSILQDVAGIIDDTIKFVKDKVLVYKFSADVYCLSNIDLEKKDFEDIVTYILGAIESEVFKQEQHEIDIRAKAGITFSPKNNKLITADLALQSAKNQNKDYVVFYDELDNLTQYENNMLWTKKLKQALITDNIIVYFQPLVNNTTLKVDKYECLVRMRDDNKIIAPFFFLDVSKKANQYVNITKIVIDKSFQEFENSEFEFSINISYEDISTPYFLYYVKDKLKKYGVAKRVVWEILEDESIKNYDILINFINEVKALECKIAIDDFGSGYSNFAHILKMNVDYLKIDASLVKNVVKHEDSKKIVKTIIDFANSLNLKTIAEYVENEDIFKITKELGSTYSQGYYFAAPLEKPDIYNFNVPKSSESLPQ
ncbi:MAG: GGDEF and EAL domain-containing protein [Campylobacterota bacterium]|nr:GGDEF and EAL domain-containing protein [Campylobacterota bacterium]